MTRRLLAFNRPVIQTPAAGDSPGNPYRPAPRLIAEFPPHVRPRLPQGHSFRRSPGGPPTSCASSTGRRVCPPPSSRRFPAFRQRSSYDGGSRITTESDKFQSTKLEPCFIILKIETRQKRALASNVTNAYQSRHFV